MNDIYDGSIHRFQHEYISGTECMITDYWGEKWNSDGKDIHQDFTILYELGVCMEDVSFFYLSVKVEPKGDDIIYSSEFEFDHKPNREECMNEFLDLISERSIDRAEAKGIDDLNQRSIRGGR